MDRRAPFLTLATSLPLLLFVALVSLGRGDTALRAEADPTPTAATPTGAPALTRTPFPTHTPPPTCTPSPTHTPSPTRVPSPTGTPSPTSPSPAASILRITALEYASADEYVEITNQGPVDEVMTGWQLASNGQKTPYTFPEGYTLVAGAAVRVHSGPGAVDNPPADLKWSGSYLWSNGGDEARLYDALGSLVDTWTY